MSKAMSYTVNAASSRAREAAREAARRQGKSLGEWLHGAIADEPGRSFKAEETAMASDRAAFVADRLGRMSAVAGDEGPNPRWKGRRAGQSLSDDRRSPMGRGPAQPSHDEMEYLIDEAVDAMARRSERTEQRTDEALTTIASMLETIEQRRDQERSTVLHLSEKLNQIETRFADHPLHGGSPIQGALARLEARLDAIGQRSTAEARATQSVVSAEFAVENADLVRLDEKLNAILNAVNTRHAALASEASPIAMAAAAPKPAFADRSLGAAIADISRRQRQLETPASLPGSRSFFTSATDDDRPAATPPATAADTTALAGVQGEIAHLASTIDGLRRDLEKRGTGSLFDVVAAMRGDMEQIVETLKARASKDAAATLLASIDMLDARIAPRLAETAPSAEAAPPDLAPLRTIAQELRIACLDLDPSKLVSALLDEVRVVMLRLDRLAGSQADAAEVMPLKRQIDEIRSVVDACIVHSPGFADIARRVGDLNDELVRPPHDGQDLIVGRTVDDLRSMIIGLPGPAALGNIEVHVRDLFVGLDGVLAQAQRPTREDLLANTSAVGDMIRDLSEKIDAARAPDSGSIALGALQQQVELLSSRFERSETGLATLAKLETSMQDLFRQLEATQAAVEATAATAAREVLRVAAEQAPRTQQPTGDTVAPRPAAPEFDERTHSRLEAIQTSLQSVLERLAKADQARGSDPGPGPDASRPAAPTLAVPAAPKPQLGADLRGPAARQLEALERALGEPDILREPLFSAPAAPVADGALARSDAAQRDAATTDAGKRDAGKDDAATDDERASPLHLSSGDSSRAAFIAAARRAAQAAKDDPTILALGAAPAADEARASLLAKSRDYVAAYKRPVLLSLAALFVTIGTMSLLQRHAAETGDAPTKVAARPGQPGVASQAALPAPDVVASADPSASAQPSQPGDVKTADIGTAAAEQKPALEAPKPSGVAQAGSAAAPSQEAAVPALPAFAAQSLGLPMTAKPMVAPGLVALAEKGDAAAAYELGVRYADGRGAPRSFKLAAQWLTTAADKGLAPARYRLASLYEKGLGVPLDKAKAKALYLQAATAGNPRAMHNLAVLLADGDGKPDYAGAAVWFRKAAQVGIHDSQYNLAVLLARGLGVQQSMMQAYQWFAIAAQAGDAEAEKKRDEIAAKLGANDLAVAKAIAKSFQPKPVDAAAAEVEPPKGGWDGAKPSIHINSARSKISSL